MKNETFSSQPSQRLMTNRTLDLAALRSFVAIAETGGVTRAARRLNLTQSAVSMQLKRLEEALGQPLFERDPRGMTPTAHGEQLLSYARRMLDLNEEVWRRMTDTDFEGELILGAPHDIVYPHVPDILRTFNRAYPRIRVSLQSTYTYSLKAQFERGEVDVILTTESRPGPEARVLAESQLMFVGAPDGTAWRQRPLPLAFEHNCIFRPSVQRALDNADIPWTMAVDSMSIRTVEASVLADFAVHAALSFTIPHELRAIDHGGALPQLPVMKVALYTAKGPKAELAERLADIVEDRWTAPGLADGRALGPLPNIGVPAAPDTTPAR